MERKNVPVALVTGSSRGIGAEIARQLAATGYHTIVNYFEDASGAQKVITSIHEAGGSAEAVAFDVSNLEQVKQFVAGVIERCGRIDVLVNNAGIVRDRSFAKMTYEEWLAVINVNLNGTMHVTSAVVPEMIRARNGGRIINISSFVAQAGNFGQTNYATAKAGIIGFTRSLALELAKNGITVNAICPGFIETEMWHSIPENVRSNILERIPLRRVGSVKDVANAVRFLVENGGYITGQTLNVNGGIFIG